MISECLNGAGSLRVFYEADGMESELINVLAIGIKEGNRLIVSGREIHLKR